MSEFAPYLSQMVNAGHEQAAAELGKMLFGSGVSLERLNQLDAKFQETDASIPNMFLAKNDNFKPKEPDYSANGDQSKLVVANIDGGVTGAQQDAVRVNATVLFSQNLAAAPQQLIGV